MTGTITTARFFAEMAGKNLFRGYVPGPALTAPAPKNEHLAAFETVVKSNPGYAGHEVVFFQVDVPTNCLFFIFVHNTNRGMAQGGTRLMPYETIDDLLFDGLRLSRAMTEKNAVAQLWWGGGKAVICPVDGMGGIDAARRKLIFERYGAFVASLHGVYVAAEDMNTTPDDMLTILSRNRFVTCLPPAAGGSSNPSPWTAQGVFQAMRAAVKHFHGKDTLHGQTVLVQGVGNVGQSIARQAAADGARLLISDTNPEALKAVQAFAPDAVIVPLDEVYATPCDIFAPSARGGGINDATIPLLKCRFVIGAANNQLGNDARDTALLAERNIVYLPDFFINRMGIINCANEQYGYLEEDLSSAVRKIYDDVLQLLGDAKKTGATPYELAIAQAKNLTESEHPIWGCRGVKIANNLLAHWNFTA